MNTDIGAESTDLDEFAGVLVNLYLVGKDGKTALALPRPSLLGKLVNLESLWEKGILAGYRAQSGEQVTIGNYGVHKTKTIRRVPEQERWDHEAIETPWMVKERSAKEEHDSPQEDGHMTSVDIEINKEIEL